MHSFKPSLLPLLLLLLHNVAAVDPLFSSCSPTSTNYSANDPYAESLNQLALQLATGAPCSGFALGSVGQSTGKANGLALCRGDVNSSACESCILAADALIRRACPFKKQAIIWYDDCLLRYSDEVFFGEIDSQDEFILVNVQNVSTLTSTQLVFNEQVVQLMESVARKAYLSTRFFSTEVLEIGQGSEKLYGLAQCSRDLDVGDCRKCLESAVGELPSCCGGKRGGRVLDGSCNVRYELYPFFNA